MTTYITCAETAKLVRVALASNFPGVKFSVKSKTYSGGASIDISWTNGPKASEIKKITGNFDGASFDGMIDLKSYHSQIHPITGERVHFGADYIFTNRRYTRNFLEPIINKVCEQWRRAPLKIVGSDDNVWFEDRYEDEYLRREILSIIQ